MERPTALRVPTARSRRPLVWPARRAQCKAELGRLGVHWCGVCTTDWVGHGVLHRAVASLAVPASTPRPRACWNGWAPALHRTARSHCGPHSLPCNNGGVAPGFGAIPPPCAMGSLESRLARAGTVTCDTCPLGRFSPPAGNASACTACPAGRVNGAQHASGCSNCSAGEWAWSALSRARRWRWAAFFLRRAV